MTYIFLRFRYICDLILNKIIDIQYTKSHTEHSLRNKFHVSHHKIVFDRSTRPIWKVYFEFIQVVYYDIASLLSDLFSTLSLQLGESHTRRRVPFELHQENTLVEIYHVYVLKRPHNKVLRYWSSTERWQQRTARNMSYLTHRPTWCFGRALPLIICVSQM